MKSSYVISSVCVGLLLVAMLPGASADDKKVDVDWGHPEFDKRMTLALARDKSWKKKFEATAKKIDAFAELNALFASSNRVVDKIGIQDNSCYESTAASCKKCEKQGQGSTPCQHCDPTAAGWIKEHKLQRGIRCSTLQLQLEKK